jgi:hypothetical protein
MDGFESVLYVLSVIAGLMLAVSIIYLRVKDWRASKSHGVTVFIPYLNVFVKPVYIYASIALAFALIVYIAG